MEVLKGELLKKARNRVIKDPISMDWVDKVFECMKMFYVERWDRLFKDEHHVNMYKKIWQNGLHGLNYDQIKFGLQLCKRDAAQPRSTPPTVMQFYRYAKNKEFPYIFTEYVSNE